jgi:WhiB family redox-sensing transcriptional regulator
VSDEIDWTEGLCTQTDPEIFFPEFDSATNSAAAKSICASCDLVLPCLTGAIERREQFGIWGGANLVTRRQIIRGHKSITIHLAELAHHKKG